MLKEYTVYMQWDSYGGSNFVETHTSWQSAYSKEDAIQRVVNQYGYHKGFKITDVSG